MTIFETYKPPLMEDMDTLARTVWGEARGEGERGMRAVAWVVLNRAAHAMNFVKTHGRSHVLFGAGTWKSACRAPWQFSCWNPHDVNRDLMERLDYHNRYLQIALKIILNLLTQKGEDITNGALYYHHQDILPSWAKKATVTAHLGKHIFYKI